MGIINWFYELGDLKRIARSGWWSAKVQRPETVAEHSFRAAVIAYVLAAEENEGIQWEGNAKGSLAGKKGNPKSGGNFSAAEADGSLAAKKGGLYGKGAVGATGVPPLNPEHVAFLALMHDAHEARVLDLHKVSKAYVTVKEGKAEKHQLAQLPEGLRRKLGVAPTKTEKIIIKDADVLELALTAREYESLGYAETRTWLRRAGEKLKTKTARKWFREIVKKSPSAWYREFRGR